MKLKEEKPKPEAGKPVLATLSCVCRESYITLGPDSLFSWDPKNTPRCAACEGYLVNLKTPKVMGYEN